MKLFCYDGKRGRMEFRFARSVDEAVEWCAKHQHVWFLCNAGDARQVKVNGAVRRWKREPKRVEVPIKYGLYEYSTFREHDLMRRLLIPVEMGQMELELVA